MKKLIKIIFLSVIIISLNFVFADDNPNWCWKYAIEWAPNIWYEWGFYSWYLTQDWINEWNFCTVWYEYPTEDQENAYWRKRARIENWVRVWNCVQNTFSDDKDIDTCTAKVLPNEESVCLSTNIAYTQQPSDTLNTPLCEKADPHWLVDPWYPLIYNQTWWDDSPWYWTCGWTYYVPKICEAPSKWECMDTSNMMYDDFQESDDLCVNWKVDNFHFNEDTYRREWTCKWSSPEYDAQCYAQKTTEQWECNFVYNNKTFSDLNSWLDLCSKWIIDNFQFNDTDEDATYWRTWTCKWSLPDLDSQCFAHKEIFQWVCNPVLISAPQETLSTWDDLCKIWNATWLYLDKDNRLRKWICQWSREKDNTECETELKTIQWECWLKNWTLCSDLTPDDPDLCTAWTVSDFYRDEQYNKRNWKCIWNPIELSALCSAQKTAPWLCNDDINWKTMTYDQIIQYPLCKEWTTDITLKEQTDDGIRRWTCVWPWWWTWSECFVKQYQTWTCANLIWMVKTLPTKLCESWKPVWTKILDWYWVWTCEWFNWAPSTQCTIECIDWKCEKWTWWWFCANWEYCDENHPCSDWSSCQVVWWTWTNDTPDWIIPRIWPWDVCNDIDWCRCWENRIFNWTECNWWYNPDDENDISNPDYKMPIFRPILWSWWSLYDANMMLAWNADLIIDHIITWTIVHKLDKVRFDIFYKNDWPDPAYWTYIAYKYSDLLENISWSVPYTVVTLDSIIKNDQEIKDYLNKNQTSNNLQTWIIESWINQSWNVQTQTIDINQPWSLNANNKSLAWEENLSTTKAYDDVYKNVIYFYIWTLKPGETWKITFEATVKNTILWNQISNIAMIQSRVNDPNKLNNTKTASIDLEVVLKSWWINIINPLLSIKPVLDKRESVIKRINAKTDFRDVIIWYPRYMHIMTVQRNWIMKWYEYKYSTLFAPKKCISRAEYLVVMARIMHMTNAIDNVYEWNLTTTPFIDVPTNNQMLVKYINRAYRRWLVDVFKAWKSLPNVLGANKPVKHKEAKEILYRLFRIMHADTKVLKPLLVWTWTHFATNCVTREEVAYTVAHILRWNPNIVMWFNDIFLQKLYEFLLPKSIIERRRMLARLILKMRQMSPSSLFKLWLDKETLLWVLDSAMKWKIYQPKHSTDSVENFFYEISDDEYDRYIKDLYK